MEFEEEILSQEDVRYFMRAYSILGESSNKIHLLIENLKKEDTEKEPCYFEERDFIILEANRDYINFKMTQIDPPFRPYIKTIVNCDLTIGFILDEKRYKEASRKGEVPTLNEEKEAMKYLEERKKTKCCGEKCNIRIF